MLSKFLTSWKKVSTPTGAIKAKNALSWASEEAAAAWTTRQQQARPLTRIQREKQEQILDAALDVFSQQGFRGATIDQIAEAAGMSKPNLLYYFGRKEDIHKAADRAAAGHLAGPACAIWMRAATPFRKSAPISDASWK